MEQSYPWITALVGGKTSPDVQELDAVSRVGADLLVAVHLAGHHAPVQVVLGAPVAVGAGAKLREVHLLGPGVQSRSSPHLSPRACGPAASHLGVSSLICPLQQQPRVLISPVRYCMASEFCEMEENS